LTGTNATVKSLNREDLVRFKEDNYHPSNIAVVAAGKVIPGKIFKYAAEKFADQKRKRNPSFKTPRPSRKNSQIKICRDETKQTHLAMGFHASGDIFVKGSL